MLRKIFGRLSEGRSEAQLHKAQWRGDYRANAPTSLSPLIILGKWAGMQAASFSRIGACGRAPMARINPSRSKCAAAAQIGGADDHEGR